MPRHSALTLASALAMALPTAAMAEPLSDIAGAYLAARHADAVQDFPAASLWYDRALRADPANLSLLQGALTADLVLGMTDKAASIGHTLLKSGDKNQFASIAVLASDILADRYAKILADQKAGSSIGALVDRLIAAWAKIGIGDMTGAQADFDDLIKNPNTQSFGIYHKALALASSGDFESAERLLSSPSAADTMKLRRAVIAQVQILSQLERNPEAVILIDTRFGTRLDDATAALRARLVKGETLPFDIARNARDGFSEVFFTIATALADQADPTFTLLYARTSTVLRPDHAEAQVMIARVLEDINQLDLAIQAFAAVPETDGAYVTAQVGAAEATIRMGRTAQAVTQLQDLSVKRPGDINIKTALGDALRRAGDCALAVKAYDAAIAMVPDPAPGNWPLFYKRAGCLLQIGNWPAAEADFRTALKLDPNQPRVLNELGYSYVDRGDNLDEALQMIQRAVAASPESGYIVDSLAWAYYRLGRFKDAVAPQEKASKLMPLDPVVTDHLGDIYWSVGRKREAEFQWHRALSFGPEDREKARIQRKLDLGLDQVLIEEKANPPAPT
ncbi:MAG: tetratricopeptide repeat protein, partial [Alphaproteobacteria bacterium]